MKELTTEEKARAYDEALERAKIWYVDAQIDFKKSLELIFPELKKGEESEDEKIRKHLITLFKNDYGKNSTARFAGIKVKDIIVWLEKQGEQKSKNESTDTCDSLIIKSKEFPASEKRDFGYFSEPADKVESKFHKGDWITDGISKCQIRFIDDAQYYYSENCILGSIESVDKRYHIWTIQDAKDGDVLAVEWNQDNDVWEKILIFKALNDNGVEGYGNTFKNKNLFFTDGTVPYYSETWTKALHPATKEQCDALMKAMADAGWEFDFDNKELKKINQEYTPKHKVGDTIYYNSFGEVKSMIVANVVTDSTDNPMYEDENGSAVFEEDLIEQKPAWSEEDENRMIILCQFLKVYGIDYYGQSTLQGTISWLKSLKDRVQPQPKQEWNEEGKQAIEDAETWLDTLCDYLKDSSSECIPTVKEVISKFKSLRPQSQWKPSDEQVMVLAKASETYCGKDKNTLYSLYNDLKKL